MNRPIESRTICLVAIRPQRPLLNTSRSAMHHNRPMMLRLLRKHARHTSRNDPRQRTQANCHFHLADLPCYSSATIRIGLTEHRTTRDPTILDYCSPFTVHCSLFTFHCSLHFRSHRNQ